VLVSGYLVIDFLYKGGTIPKVICILYLIVIADKKKLYIYLDLFTLFGPNVRCISFSSFTQYIIFNKLVYFPLKLGFMVPFLEIIRVRN